MHCPPVSSMPAALLSIVLMHSFVVVVVVCFFFELWATSMKHGTTISVVSDASSGVAQAWVYTWRGWYPQREAVHACPWLMLCNGIE